MTDSRMTAAVVSGSSGTTINRGLKYFERDQEWVFRIRAWDTPQTALENDIATEGLQLRVYEPSSTTAWSSVITALRATTGTTAPSFANTKTLVNDGRWPLIQSYWGGGSPNWWGATTPGKIAVVWKGALVANNRRSWLSGGTTFTFAAAGSGLLRVDKITAGGTRTTAFTGTNGWVELSEGNYLANGFTFSAAVALTPGDSIEVFYVQTGSEPWGGIVVKAIPAASGTNAVAAEAPVVSGGLFSYADKTATTLPFILSADVEEAPGIATQMAFMVPLVNPDLHDGNGWVYNRADDRTDPGRLQLFDGGQSPAFVLKRKRLVQLQVALRENPVDWQTLFTGHVHDFDSGADGRITVQCLGFESRMVEQYEQAPDRISYMARGFRNLDFFDPDASSREPVYNIPAFDHWPLAWAVEELGLRAGIDPSCFRQPWTELGPNATPVQVVLPWGDGTKFRATSLTGERVNLPRPVHYGNAGLAFTETRPFDDDYVFKVDATKDLWARARELTDRLGYIWRFDHTGAALLYPAAVPSFSQDFTAAANATLVTNPSAHGAGYLQGTGAVTVTATVKASRIDASFPRYATARPWTVTVARSSAPAVTIYSCTVDPSTTVVSSTPYLYYNSPTADDGTNATQVTLYTGAYDEYVVTLSSAVVAGKTAYIDCLFLYPYDPDNSTMPTLSTSDTALTVITQPQQDATRNKVTIVGRRKGAVTDSDKFAEAQAPTEQEFVVANAVDVASIVNPTASNYIGFTKQSVIYDNSISDDGFARYLAQVYIYRQRNPQPGAQVAHPLLPVVRLHDPVAVEETKFDTTKALTRQYVRKIRHTISLNNFRSTLETESWPEFPAYMPRTDINLASFGNKPVINLSINYTSLAGYAVTDPRDGEQTVPSGAWGYTKYNWVTTVPETLTEPGLREYNNLTVQAGTPQYLQLPSGAPWPPVPGTLQVKPNTINEAAVTSTPAITIKSTVMGGLSLEYYGVGTRVFTIDLAPDWIATGVKLDWQPISDISAGAAAQGFPLSWTAGLNDRTKEFYYSIVDNVLIVYRGALRTYTVISDFGLLLATVSYKSTGDDIRKAWLGNSPYHNYTDFSYAAAASPIINLPWQQAKGHGRSAVVTSYDVRYRPFYATPVANPNIVPAHAGTTSIPDTPFSPFYDPYTSELGHVVNISMDVLADGLYRVSVRSRHDDTVVAWLTNPQAEAREEEQHWEYMSIASQRTFTWDGVDQIGEWNAAQSSLYEQLVGGAFSPDAPSRVGQGYYVWNREVSGSGLGPQAYIWMKTDAAGKPVIGHGTYAAWYVCVEAVTDALTATNRRATVNSDGVVLTHLPEPTKLELKIEDLTYSSAAGTGTVTVANGVATFTSPQTFVLPAKIVAGALLTDGARTFQIVSGSGTTWAVTPNDLSVPAGTTFTRLTGTYNQQTVADWNQAAYPSDTTLGAYINTSKPLRVRFRVANRPGALWAGKGDQVSVKLTREVHLRALIADQIIKYAGSAFPGTPVEERTIYNRRLTNDEHTQQYADSGFRQASSFKWTDADTGVTEWVFSPANFKSDFKINDLEESINFGDYLQLEEVPSWSEKRDVAAPRARLQFALMSYLFYLSAFVTDRSGRSVWGINKEFVDKSKIFDTTAGIDWPDDPMYQQRRTVVCRQWTEEDNWVYRQKQKFGFASGTIAECLLQHWWYQHEVSELSIGTTPQTWSSFALGTDYYSYNHRTTGSVDSNLKLPVLYGSLLRQLGRVVGQSNGDVIWETSLNKNVLGQIPGGSTWTWAKDPLWIPSITRDFHPYFLLPPMFVPAKDGSTPGFEVAMNTINMYTTAGSWEGITIRNRDGDESKRVDAGAAEVWSSGTFEMSVMRNAPTSTSTSLVRWRPTKEISGTTGDFKPYFLGADAGRIIGYVRQDETVHYEDVRGVYSRGKYPTAQPIKVAATSPYYINQFQYGGVQVGGTLQRSNYPLFHVIEHTNYGVGLGIRWFRQAFRSEYVWESASLFPTSLQGAEKLAAALWWRTRYLPSASVSTIYYDYGAWTGWKDDLEATSNVIGGVRLGNGTISSPFITQQMPVGVGPILKTTYELTAHLVLVPERRGSD